MTGIASGLTVFLASSCLCLIVSASVIVRTRREINSQPGCPQTCVNKEKYRTLLNREIHKARNYLRKFAEGAADGLLIHLSPEKWEHYCRELEGIRTCLSSCNHPEDNSTMQLASAFLELASSIFCNADVRTSITCLTDVSNQQSERCKSKCNLHKQAFVKTYKAFIQSRPISPDDPDKAIEGLCRLINCRLFCRKTEIIEYCETQGFQAAKALVRAVGQFLQRFSDRNTSHSRIVGPLTISGHCTPEKLVEEPS